MTGLFSELRRLWSYASHLRSDVKVATIYSITNKVFDLAPPILIGMAVDIVVKKKESLLASFGLESVMSQLYVLAFLTLVVWVCESIFEYLYQVRWRVIAQQMQHALRVDAYEHLQGLELRFYEDKSTGNLISVLNDDVNQLERFLDGGASTIIQVMTTISVVGMIFFYLSPNIAIFSFIPVPIILLGSFYYQKVIQPRYKAVRDQAGELSSFLNNNILGMATIKSYTAEQTQWQRLVKKSNDYSEVNAHAIKLSSSFSPLIRMVILMGFLCTLLLGGYYTTTGELAVGSYSVLVFMTQRLLWPLTGLGAVFDLYQRAMASTGRIFNLMDTPKALEEGDYQGNGLSTDIIFDQVSFSYDQNHMVLQNINLKISKGQSIGLVGATGSGKSSLVKLLLRFYETNEGLISILGVDIKKWKFSSLREKFSYVGQDVYLFNGTVAENIGFGSEGSSEAQIEMASRKAWAHEFITKLPEGYQTQIGERGQKLSGGQKQRLSLARAILKDAPIFIFDEATSAVDNETEALIQKSLNELSLTKTAIIIAHRLSTVVSADAIYVLNDGQVIERGDHKTLMCQKGVYEKLWQVQTGSSDGKEHLSAGNHSSESSPAGLI